MKTEALGNLTPYECALLLSLARDTIHAKLQDQPPPPLKPVDLPQSLNRIQASFVTLTCKGNLRGCLGSLKAQFPLAEDVSRHAIAAATCDPRFPPLIAKELPYTVIEISALDPPIPLIYDNPLDIPKLLRPGEDGVMLKEGPRHATFLPQVWEMVPDPVLFLNMLCLKAHLPKDSWQKGNVTLLVYGAQHFQDDLGKLPLFTVSNCAPDK